MNKFLGIGNLTKAIEVKYTETGIAVSNFILAIQRETKKEDGTRDADFINCVAYGKQAETMAKYLDKGSQVSIEGRIQTGSYDNKEGKKVYTTVVVVEKITFIKTPKKEETATEETQTETIQKAMKEDPYEEMAKRVEEESDLPF